MLTESAYLDSCVALLQSLLSPDSLGNCAILKINPNSKQDNPALKRIQEIRIEGTPPSSPSSKVSQTRDVVGDVAMAIYPHTSIDDDGDLAVLEVANHSYQMIPFMTTIRAIAIHLYHKPRDPLFLSFQPKHVHYKTLALSKDVMQSDRLVLLKAAIFSIHELVSKEQDRDLKRWKAEKPAVKKRVVLLARRVDELKKELDSLTTLSECWSCQKALDAAESEYDVARLQTIPPECSIKLVGAGFKVGVRAIWLENLVAPFQLQTVNSPVAGIQMDIGGDTREQTGMGLVKFRADGIYLRADNFPKSIKLDSFSARCDFVSSVPINFKEKRQSWKVGSGLKISLKKIEPRMTTASGNSVKPPQTLIRFIVEQVLKILIASNLKRFIPPELGQYLSKVKPERMNSISGTLSVSGPHAGDLEANLCNEENESSTRGRKLLNLTKIQAASFVSFATNFCKVDLSTTAKLTSYVKAKIILEKNKATAPDLVSLWQKGYNTYCTMNSFGEEAAIDVDKLFCALAKQISRNPISIKMELQHIDASLETQTALKGLTNLLTRVIYENFGGRGVVYDETEELSDAIKREMKANPPDDILLGVRQNINGVIIPLRRSLLILGNHLSRLTCSVEASVNNVESNAPADLRIDMENVEILCTPSLPLTVGDFLTRNYLTTVKQYELEGQKGRKRFMFEIVKETNELDKVLGGEQGEEGSLEEVRLRGFFQNMRSKMVYDPLAMMNQETIGMIELGMMRSCWRRDGHENSEVFLRSEGLLDDQVCRPLLIHFNSELMRVKCKFMVILQELVHLVRELLLFGGAKFDPTEPPPPPAQASPSNRPIMPPPLEMNDDDDEAMMRDLRDRLSRIILIVLKVVSKHTSTENFKFQLNSSLRVSTDKGNNIILDFEGNADSRTDKMPLELEWTTTFVDIVDDFKSCIDEFRKTSGPEDGALAGGSTPQSPTTRMWKGKGRRRSSVERMQRFFGLSKKSSPSSAG